MESDGANDGLSLISPCHGLLYTGRNKTSYKILRQRGSFWNSYEMIGIIKALKCCQNLYQVVVCLCTGAINKFEIAKKCNVSLPAQDQVSGESYRTVGTLVSFSDKVRSLRYRRNIHEVRWGLMTISNLRFRLLTPVPIQQLLACLDNRDIAQCILTPLWYSSSSSITGTIPTHFSMYCLWIEFDWCKKWNSRWRLSNDTYLWLIRYFWFVGYLDKPPAFWFRGTGQ